MTRRRITIAAIALLALTGCSSAETETSTGAVGRLRTYTVDLPDGRAVLCVVYSSANKGGVSCDWDNAR